MGASAYTLRRLGEDDWAILRAVRLRALLDSPASFGTLHSDAEAWTVERWRRRARGSALSADLVAFAEGEPVGMAGCRVDPAGGDAEVISVWVDPSHRGTGLGRRLVLAAMGWAGQAGARRFRLFVTEGNDPARRLYEAVGFVPSGRRQPLPGRPWLDEVEMRRELTPPP
ncbi:MAG: GNAT family N-acetyltransferase [Candidatus Dormibacteria bacterium]